MFQSRVFCTGHHLKKFSENKIANSLVVIDEEKELKIKTFFIFTDVDKFSSWQNFVEILLCQIRTRSNHIGRDFSMYCFV